MKVFQFDAKLPPFTHPVITMGTFDGVHIGHQTIINRLNELAHERGGESVLLTFHPHPRLVLNPADTDLQLLNTLDEKIHWLEHFGLDNLVIAHFSKSFSQTSPKDYIQYVLVDKFNPEVVVIGYDHHFGKDRTGGLEEMQQFSEVFGYRVIEIPKQLVDDLSVSSTKVRQAVSAGELTVATKLLGHPYSLSGKVVTGHGVGVKLGYPTANLLVEDPNKLVPGTGIYATYVVADTKRYQGMLYIGERPTFHGKEIAIEVNLFDYEGNLYGKNLHLEIVADLRRDQHFDSSEALIAQIAKDKEDALAVLNQG